MTGVRKKSLTGIRKVQFTNFWRSRYISGGKGFYRLAIGKQAHALDLPI